MLVAISFTQKDIAQSVAGRTESSCSVPFVLCEIAQLLQKAAVHVRRRWSTDLERLSRRL